MRLASLFGGTGRVASSRARGLKLHPVRRQLCLARVASSRARGLKRNRAAPILAEKSRVLTGAWIETTCATTHQTCWPSRVLTGAWIETGQNFHAVTLRAVASSRARGLKRDPDYLDDGLPVVASSRARGLKRAAALAPLSDDLGVASSRARGLKLPVHPETPDAAVVASSRARGLKPADAHPKQPQAGRVLTGAWIETGLPPQTPIGYSSRPHGRVD